MERIAYNQCISQGFKTHKKELAEYPQPFKFCVIAKSCAGRVKDLQEAIAVCSQPKEPKQPKAPHNKVNCEQNMEEITQCLVGKITPATTAKEIYETLVKCHCKKNPKEIKMPRINPHASAIKQDTQLRA